MSKNNNKTRATDQDAMEFINGLDDAGRISDSLRLVEIMTELTGFNPYMYGRSIVGFGNYHYKYASGREGDAPLVGFSPRKRDFSLYLAPYEGRGNALTRFGKHSSGVGCVYIKQLADVSLEILREMIIESVRHYRRLYPEN